MVNSTNGYSQPVQNGTSNEIPVGRGIQQLDDTLNKPLALDLSTGDKTLTPVQLMNAILLCNGASAARIVTCAALPFRRFVVNNGAFDVTFKEASTAGVIVTAGSALEVWSDGTTVKAIVFSASTSATSIQGVPVAITAPTTGQILKFDGTSYAPATDSVGTGGGGGSGGGGSGGGTSLILPVETPPVTASVWDDGFADSKWSSLNSACPASFTVENGMFSIEPALAGTGNTGFNGGLGVCQNAPLGSFDMTAKLRWDYRLSEDCRFGLFCGSTTATQVVHISGSNRPNNCRSIGHKSNTAFSLSANWGTPPPLGAYGENYVGAANYGIFEWLRIKWDATALLYSLYFSTTGLRWTLATTTAGVQPTHIGLCDWRYSIDMKADQAYFAEYFRVKE